MKISVGRCELCGLPLPFDHPNLAPSAFGYHFCCVGCKKVFQMLFEASADPDPNRFRDSALFRKCRELGIIPSSEADRKPPVPAPLDKAEHPNVSVEPKDGERLLDTLIIEDMWCPACAWVIEEALNKQPGLDGVCCNFFTDRVRFRYDPLVTSPSEVIRFIERVGYRADFDDTKGILEKEEKRELLRFAVSAFLTANVMMLSFSLYSGFFIRLSPSAVFNLSWPIFFLATTVLFYGGRDIYRRAWAGLFSAAFSMEALITAGTLSAYLYSTLNLFSGSLHLYFDTASMLVTLVLLGKFLERRTKRRILKTWEGLQSLRPTKVRVCSDLFPQGRYQRAQQLQVGDLFILRDHEIAPADGLVLEGEATMDESSLTGEATPIKKKEGDPVRSGARMIQGTLKIKAEKVGANSFLGQLLEIIEKAMNSKAPFEGRTEAILRWFVPLILFLAGSTALIGLALGVSLEESTVRAITVLVVACPCALGIAIPLARVAGVSLGANRGILIREFSAFGEVEEIDDFVLDKTGTVTQGSWSLKKIIALDPFKEKDILAMAAALEWNSHHPIAVEIRKEAQNRKVAWSPAEQVNVFENGLSGRIQGQEARIGSREFLEEGFGDLDLKKIDHLMDQVTGSFVFLALGRRLCAILDFGDRIRKGSHYTVKKLQERGHRVFLVSGDHEKSTEEVGRRIGANGVYGERPPWEKAHFVKGLQDQGKRVVMVGDGINDAPALAQANLAIALHSGNPPAEETAHLILMRGEPVQILDFISLAQQVNTKIRQNLFCAFLYNILSIPIAMSGLLSPLVAVCAMLMSSLTVITNTSFLLRSHDKPTALTAFVPETLEDEIQP